VTSSHSSELRAYKDKIIINEGGDIAYEERLEPEREADVTIDSLYASRSQTVTTTGKAGAWTCEVGDERYLSAAVVRNANGSATVTVTGLAETSEEQTVSVYASSGTGTEPMLVKVITVRAVVALPPEPAAEEDIAVSIDAGASSNIVTTTAADSWSCKVPSGMSNYVTASATRQADGTATISISTRYAYGSPIAVEVYAHSDVYAKDYLVKTITVTVVGEIEVIPASEGATNITVATAGVLQVVTTTGAATHWNCRCVAKSDVDWAACIEASVVRNADGTATVTVLPKGAYGDKLTVEVYAGSTVPGEGTLIKKITVSKIVAATVALRLKEGETFVTNCTFGVAHPWSCSTDKSGAYVTASVTTAEATETTLTIVGKAVGTETVTVKRTNGSYTTEAYKFAVTVVTGEPTPYENLRAAFEVGTGTYALEADVVCPAGEPLTLAAGKSFVLDLKGHSLTCRRDGAIVNAGDLTIRDSTASGPFAAHVSFSEEELDAGCALVRNRAGAKLTVDGVCVDAGSISGDDYESACANTAVSDEGGTVVVTNGAHVGGLCGIEAKGDCAIMIEDGASVCGTSWRGTGGRQLSTAVLFASGTSVLTVRNATLDSEGWLVRSLEGSAATVSVTGAILWSERASVPFELASGTSVSVVGSNYADLSNIPAVTALANAGAALTVGAGCTLTVSGEGVIGFLGEGVRVEAAGTRTWRTVAESPSGGVWAAVSQALGAETEFAHEPAVSFVTLEALPTAEGRDLTVRVAVRDGEDIRKVDPAKVAGFVEATSDLFDWTAGKVGLTVKSAVRNDDNTMDITLAPEASVPAAFIRIRVP